MADDALQRLEALRAEAVELSRRALGDAGRVRAQARETLHAARARQLAVERAQQAARHEFAQAASVASLRAAELRQRALDTELRTASEQVAHDTRAERRAEQQHQACVEALREAEVARRAVGRGVERRAAAVSLRTERRAEDDADDQHRAAMRVRAGSKVPSR